MAATMTATTVQTSSAAAVATPTIATPTHTQIVQTYETVLHRALLESNRIAKVDPSVTLKESDVEMTHQIATAKMLNYCVRMLHAGGWHPPTILRAMALRESGLERGMRETMFQALRERRKELEVFRMKKAVAHGAEIGPGGGTDPGSGQTMYHSRSSPKSSPSSGGNGSSGRGGSGSGSDRRASRHGHGIGYGTRRGDALGRGGHHNSHVHSYAQGMLHPHTDLYSRHHGLVGADPAIEFANDATTNNNQHLQTHPVIADGAVSRNTSTIQMGGNGQPVSLI